jgi:hypothetical protein
VELHPVLGAVPAGGGPVNDPPAHKFLLLPVCKVPPSGPNSSTPPLQKGLEDCTGQNFRILPSPAGRQFGPNRFKPEPEYYLYNPVIGLVKICNKNYENPPENQAGEDYSAKSNDLNIRNSCKKN